jgi:hypothetical protein
MVLCIHVVLWRFLKILCFRLNCALCIVVKDAGSVKSMLLILVGSTGYVQRVSGG